jgi:hypothetical protein
MLSILSHLPSFRDVYQAIPPLPILAARALPLIPVAFASNVLAISTEWHCHLQPLPKLQGPITGRTLSEVFRKAYINGAYTFLINLFISIGSSGYLWLALTPDGVGYKGTRWFRYALTSGTMEKIASHMPIVGGNGSGTFSAHPLQHINSLASSSLPLRRSLYLLTCVFGIMHLFPFGLIIFPHVMAASKPSASKDPEERTKHEDEVKQALARWLGVNKIRIWTDVAAAVCAFLALIV